MPIKLSCSVISSHLGIIWLVVEKAVVISEYQNPSQRNTQWIMYKDYIIKSSTINTTIVRTNPLFVSANLLKYNKIGKPSLDRIVQQRSRSRSRRFSSWGLAVTVCQMQK